MSLEECLSEALFIILGSGVCIYADIIYYYIVLFLCIFVLDSDTRSNNVRLFIFDLLRLFSNLERGNYQKDSL